MQFVGLNYSSLTIRYIVESVLQWWNALLQFFVRRSRSGLFSVVALIQRHFSDYLSGGSSGSLADFHCMNLELVLVS